MTQRAILFVPIYQNHIERIPKLGLRIYDFRLKLLRQMLVTSYLFLKKRQMGSEEAKVQMFSSQRLISHWSISNAISLKLSVESAASPPCIIHLVGGLRVVVLMTLTLRVAMHFRCVLLWPRGSGFLVDDDG